MKIISCTSCNVFFPKYKLFSNPSAHANIKTCEELFLANRSLILWGKLCNHSKGRSARQDSCLVNGMSALGIESNNSMPTFMVRSKLGNQKKQELVLKFKKKNRLKNYKIMDARTISPSVRKKTVTCLFWFVRYEHWFPLSSHDDTIFGKLQLGCIQLVSTFNCSLNCCKVYQICKVWQKNKERRVNISFMLSKL